jgi:high-affinity iron transporter
VAAGGTWSFFALALFAILREGAEAVVFFLGIAPGISPGQLLAGVGAALVVLAALGYLLIRFSVKLPLHWLFLAATVLIYYVAFKVAGEAVRSLQIAGIMPAHDVPGLPSARFLGMTPTWETFVPQAAVLFLVIGEVTLTELRRARAAWKKAQAAPGST